MRGENDRPTASIGTRIRSRIGRGLIVAMAVCFALGGECDPKRSSFFDPIDDDLIPGQGDIFGTVTVDGVGRGGVSVTVRRGGVVVDMVTTDANGDYEVINLDPGTYTVSVGSIDGATCPGDQSATVFADEDVRVDFACTSQPATGTVTGTVTANGSPVSGATVTLNGRTATSATNGSFTFTDVDPGSYDVSASASGFDCQATTVTVTAGETATADIACTGPPSGAEIAANPYSLAGTIMGTDACGLGATISNPGPITIRFDPATNTITIESDADVAGTYAAGQPWTGTGQTTFSSGGMSFILRETVMGTWQRMGGTIVLPGTLRFEVLQGSTEVCESSYAATYTQLTASSARFKTGVTYLLPDGGSILGLRPAAYRYLASHGDPRIPRLGLIAEDVARVYPAAVGFDVAGRPWGIAYGELGRLVLEEIGSRTAAEGKRWLERVARRVSPG